MDFNQFQEIRKRTNDQGYKDFISDNGWKYQTEEQMLAGFMRQSKAKQGTPLTLEEFLAELQIEGDPVTAQRLYSILRRHMNNGILSAYGLYQYARFQWCINDPEAVVAYQTGPKCWEVNSCDTSISEERAVLLVNSEWGFEASRIKLVGTPYYEATDWNFICFRCGPYDWLMRDGELYQIYQ